MKLGEFEDILETFFMILALKHNECIIVCSLNGSCYYVLFMLLFIMVMTNPQLWLEYH